MKAQEIKISTIKRRLKKMYKLTPSKNFEISKNWYSEANKFSQEISKNIGVSSVKISAVLSALSPSVSWDTNKKDAENMIKVFVNFGTFENCSFSTYTQNALKAWNILNDIKVESSKEIFNKYFNNGKSGFKTASFFMNIAEPQNENFVTIDRHQFAICRNLKKSSDGKTPSKKVYEILKNAHIETAKELKILPQELQAVTWSTYRTEVLGYQFH